MNLSYVPGPVLAPLFCLILTVPSRELPRWHSGEEFACQCKRLRRCGFDPWMGKTPGGGNGNSPLQNSCLENPMGRGDWQAIFHWGHKEWDTAEQLSTTYTCVRMHTHTHTQTDTHLQVKIVINPVSKGENRHTQSTLCPSSQS